MKGSPYQLEFMFSGCLLTDIVPSTNVTFHFPADFFLTNCEVVNLEIDYGMGYKSIFGRKSLQVNLKEGTNEILLRATLKDGKVLLSHASVTVQKGDNNLVRTVSKDPLTVNLVQTVRGKEYRGISTSATVSIAYGKEHNSILKPFIFVEGLDPRVSPSSTRGSSHIENLDSKVKALHDNGFDIIYVDWANSEEYI